MIEQKILFRGDDVTVAVHRLGDAVTCTDDGTGAGLGVYTLASDTLDGDGPLTDDARVGIVAELRRCEPPAWVTG